MLKSVATRILLPALCLASLVNCGGPSGTGPGEGGGKPVSSARFTLSLGKVGVLSKTSAITLSKLVLTAVSQATPSDTVADTSRVHGNEAQTVKRVVALASGVSWVVSAKTLDQRDSVIHSGATPPFTVTGADTSEVSLALASRFVMYQARFNNLPDSVSAAGASSKAGIALDRLVLRVDGVLRADSSVPAGQRFAAGQTVVLQFDYVTPGAHTVVLEAYGTLDGAMAGGSGLLFSGTTTFLSTAGEDGSQPVTLHWAGPSTGGAPVTLILGHIGKATVLGDFNPML